ncbi:MAG: Gldg family protein [Chloroflexota bacterium]|nr:Gldg family protein [Chloroflexota bacterium]
MKKEWRRFAPIGLYLALAAALVSFGLYVVQREFNLYLQISLGLIVLGLAAFAVLDPNRVRETFTGRRARYGSNSLVLTLAFVGILVVVNYFVSENSKRWDLTEGKKNTLAAETLDTLDTLPETVTATAFFSPQISMASADGLLENYKFSSEGKFEYEVIDPISNPGAAQAAGITKDGTVVFSMGDRQELVTVQSEREYTGALVRLMSDVDRVVYFLTGHGEFSPDDQGDQSYAHARATLESKNYTVQILNLLSENQIPEDASVVVVAGPLHPLTENEIVLLDDYVSKGGALMVLAEPLPLTNVKIGEDLLAEYLTNEWGLTVGEDIIIDPTSQQPFVVYAAQYGDHLVTQKMQQVGTAFPTVRSVQVDASIGGATGLVFTAAQSWAETNLDAVVDGSEIGLDEQDIAGPLVVAAVAESMESGGRVVVFGDSEFAANAYFANLGNGDMFINTVDWAVGQEELINLTPRDTTQRFLPPPQPYIINLILLVVVFVLPGAVLASGVVVWVQKRRRG